MYDSIIKPESQQIDHLHTQIIRLFKNVFSAATFREAFTKNIWLSITTIKKKWMCKAKINKAKSKRNNQLLFSDVGKILNPDGALTHTNWLGYGNCKDFCMALFPNGILNRNKTGLTFTSFDKHGVLNRRKNSTLNNQSSVDIPRSTSLKQSIQVHKKDKNKLKEISFKSESCGQLTISRHANYRIALRFPNKTKEILTDCQKAFNKISSFIGHSECRYVCPNNDLVMIIKNKTLVTVYTNKALVA